MFQVTPKNPEHAHFAEILESVLNNKCIGSCLLNPDWGAFLVQEVTKTQSNAFLQIKRPEVPDTVLEQAHLDTELE